MADEMAFTTTRPPRRRYLNDEGVARLRPDGEARFPKGRWFGSATHVWTVVEVEEWLAERPAERPVPDASTPKRWRSEAEKIGEAAANLDGDR